MIASSEPTSTRASDSLPSSTRGHDSLASSTRAPDSRSSLPVREAQAGVFAREHRALTVGILLSITAVAIEGMAVATIMPSVAVDLGGLEFYGWAFSAFMLTSLVGAIAAGQVADRRGPALPASAGFAFFAAGLTVAGVAPAWPVLLLGRAIQGLGAGAMGSASYVVVGRYYPERLRPRLMALLASAWVIPALVGPAVAGEIAEHASWRWVFMGILPAVAIGAWMLLRSLAPLAKGSEPSRVPVLDTATSGPTHAEAESVPSMLAAPVLAPMTGSQLKRTAIPRTRLARVLTAPRFPRVLTTARLLRVLITPRLRSGVRRLAAVCLTLAVSRVLTAVRLTAGVALVLLAASLDLPLALLPGAVGLVLAAPALRSLLPPARSPAPPACPRPSPCAVCSRSASSGPSR